MFNFFFQKLQRRREVLNKCTSIEEEKRAKLKVVMHTQYMSSEDTDSLASFSCSYDGLGVSRNAKPLRRRQLLWRSKFVNEAFSQLDKRHERRLSKMGAGFIHERKDGSASSRPVPDGAPSWAVRERFIDRS